MVKEAWKFQTILLFIFRRFFYLFSDDSFNTVETLLLYLAMNICTCEILFFLFSCKDYFYTVIEAPFKIKVSKIPNNFLTYVPKECVQKQAQLRRFF